MTLPKLDKYTKARIRDAARRRADVARTTLFEGAKATLHEIAERIARARWDTPEQQADMLIVEKYVPVNIITGVNLRIQDPDTHRYEHTFGVLMTLDIKMPGGSKHFDGDVYNYMNADGISVDEPDWAALWQIVQWRRDQVRLGYEECDAIDAFMKSTSSVARVIEQYPWTAELFVNMQKAA